MTLNELEQTIAKLKEQGVDGNEQVYIEDRESRTISPIESLKAENAYRYKVRFTFDEEYVNLEHHVNTGGCSEVKKIKALLIS